MKDLIHQLEEVGQLAQGLFGVVGGSADAWEAQFCLPFDEAVVEEEEDGDKQGQPAFTAH